MRHWFYAARQIWVCLFVHLCPRCSNSATTNCLALSVEPTRRVPHLCCREKNSYCITASSLFQERLGTNIYILVWPCERELITSRMLLRQLSQLSRPDKRHEDGAGGRDGQGKGLPIERNGFHVLSVP